MQTGTTRKRISRGNLSTIKIPVPPINEQIRIAFKIDELFSGLENGLENLKKMQNQLKVYQQALLKSAFEGNLTRKWREENKPESAVKIIAKIKAEREIQYKNDLEKWKENLKAWKEVDNQEKKPNKPQEFNYLNGFLKEELLNFSELPELWNWVKIDIIIENSKNALKAGPFGSSLKKEFYVKKGYKIYGQEQVISGNAYLGNYYVNKKKFNELSSCKVKPNDILISLVGTVGKVLILPENSEEGIINPRLVKVSLNEQFFHPPLFKYYFESSFLKKIYSTQTHGATMDVLNLGIIKTLPFPLINLDEQIIISQELELQFSIIENLEKVIFICLKDINILRQSILNKAFNGKLLVQISDDEASQELLKRIKVEKQKFLEELKKEIKSRPKKTKTMNKELSIEDVLKTSDKPMLSKDVWQQSKHKNNIEDFYKELKKIQSNVLEIKKENQSLLSLVK